MPLRLLVDYGSWLRDLGRQERLKEGLMKWHNPMTVSIFLQDGERRVVSHGKTSSPTGWGPVFGHISGQFPLLWNFTDFSNILGTLNILDGSRSLSPSFPASQIGCSRHSQCVALMPWDTFDYFGASFPSLLWLWCTRSL